MFKPAATSTKFLSFLAVLLLLSACKKESGPWWDADFSGPVAKAELNISNLLPDSVLTADLDSALRIAFTANLFNYAVDSLVNIPDTVLQYDYISPFSSVAIAPAQQIYAASSENYFGISNVSLTYAKIKSGIIKFEAENSVAEPTVFKYYLTSSNLGGQVFGINEEIPGGTISNPGIVTKYYTIDGIELDLTGFSGNKYNTVTIRDTIAISPNASSNFLTAGQGLKSKISFLNIVPLHAKGYVGDELVEVGPDTVDFSFFKGLNADYFALQDANVNLIFTNGFGAELAADNISISSLNTGNGNQISLSGSGVSSSYHLNRAVFSGATSNPVVPYIKTIPLNSTNSNIKSFIENLPDRFFYAAKAQVNPLGNISNNNDFVYYGYGFRGDMEMDIPLAFAATNLKLSDTVDFNMGGVSQTDNVNSGQLVLRVENGYPFDAQIQALVCDENYAVLDSLFISPNTALAGNIDASLKVTSRKLSLLYAPLSSEKFEKIKNARKIILKVTMNTVSQQQIVKIYDYYSMGITLTADINYSVNKN
jgi:hypothetical protein